MKRVKSIKKENLFWKDIISQNSQKIFKIRQDEHNEFTLDIKNVQKHLLN